MATVQLHLYPQMVRLSAHIEVPPPNPEAGKAISGVSLSDRPTADNIDTTVLAKQTDGYVGADIEQVVEKSTQNIAEEIITNNTSTSRGQTDDIVIGLNDLLATMEKYTPTAAEDSGYR